MPIPIITTAIVKGLDSLPYVDQIAKATACLSSIYLLKRYFNGAKSKADKPMASKVIMVTGGTSGIGAEVVRHLAKRGAQIIVLTQHASSDPFLVEYIDDMRKETENQLIYAEQCDLASLYSVRKFATKWIDNKPVRRLDMVVLCGNVVNPRKEPKWTIDGLNEEWQINYLANYHLLGILSPALRAQPPDRDVRIVFASCSSYIGGTLDFKTLDSRTMPKRLASTKTTLPNDNVPASSTPQSTKVTPKSEASKKKKQKPTAKSTFQPYTVKPRVSNMYSTSKLALMIFAHAFQQHLTSFDRPDKHVNNAQVLLVDPGFTRTPGMRRYLTGGSLWALLLYLITWPICWLVLKDPIQGSQSILMACMDDAFSAEAIHAAGAAEKMGMTREQIEAQPFKPGQGVSGRKMIKECRERDIARKEIGDLDISKQLWEYSQKQIEEKEKEAAILRALEKKERELREAEEKAKAHHEPVGPKEKTPGSRRSKKIENSRKV
ncbi:hypothetical protein KEM54_002723 [Ascosphaera aggregata]|nr:hypothetical protein KEM54_002723 [Ascosphaera aggregata]